mgnify:CR=1 FL=1
MKAIPEISIIAPVYNETESLEAFHKEIARVMTRSKRTWELLLVDDGSSDGSTDMIRKLALKDRHVRPVIFARNFGHQIAVTAGLDYCRGKAAVVIDAETGKPVQRRCGVEFQAMGAAPSTAFNNLNLRSMCEG